MKKTLILFLSIFCFTCFTPYPLAAQQSPVEKERMEKALKGFEDFEEDEGRDSFYYQLTNMLFVLGLIVIFMMIAAWFVRRFMVSKQQQMNLTSTIKILESRNLSNKSMIYLVEVYDKHVLVGESQQNITSLAEFRFEDDEMDQVKPFREVVEKEEQV